MGIGDHCSVLHSVIGNGVGVCSQDGVGGVEIGVDCDGDGCDGVVNGVADDIECGGVNAVSSSSYVACWICS